MRRAKSPEEAARWDAEAAALRAALSADCSVLCWIDEELLEVAFVGSPQACLDFVLRQRLPRGSYWTVPAAGEAEVQAFLDRVSEVL